MLPMIVSDIKDADRRKFMTGLYEEYSRLMYRTAWNVLNSQSGLEDVIQDALVSLIQKADLLRQLDRPKLVCYIVHTVRNTAIKQLNYKSRTDKHVVGLDFGVMTAEGEDQNRPLEDLLLERERFSEFRQVWDVLPEREKMLLRGKYVFHESDAELAARIGCRPGSVRMALTRAKRLVIKELERRQNDDTPGKIRGTI